MGSIAESGKTFARRIVHPAVFLAGTAGAIYFGGIAKAEIPRAFELNERSHSAEMRSASMGEMQQLNDQFFGSAAVVWYSLLGAAGSAGVAGLSAASEVITIWGAINNKKRKSSPSAS